MNDDLELLRTPIPGPRSAALIPALREHESRNITYLTSRFPIFWESASGATVVDADGNRYIDLTAAFGVANTGHNNPRVVDAVRDQAARLMHGMGDVHPSAVKSRLLERLASIVPFGPVKMFLATGGAEAVEAAMKTAMLATGKPRVAAFRNAYHGLTLGTLPVTGVAKFREPFADALPDGVPLLDFPDAQAGTRAGAALDTVRAQLALRDDVAAIVVEPIQGRGGVIVPPDGFLAGLRRLCDERGMLLIVDEIFTGYGRTGDWFAMQHDGVAPDVLCIGKAMGGGFPISAAVARAEVMDAWPVSSGEALHTSTFLGNPMGCAAALAVIDEMQRLDLPAAAQHLGLVIEPRLHALLGRNGVRAVRGRGLMWAIQLPDAAAAERTVVEALARGVLLLQAGPEGDALSLTPPLTISQRQLFRAIDVLEEVLDEQDL